MTNAQAQGNSSMNDMWPGLYATIYTSKGEIIIDLEYEKAPMTVGNFVGLAKGNIKNSFREEGEPFYDGLTFHRMIDSFMIQGGDPQGTASGGPGYKFPDEIDPSLKHDKAGTLSMANAGPGTNGSQFFITHKETPWLDGKHTVFGYVEKGQDVVNAIEKGDVIDSIRITAVGSDAEQFEGSETFYEMKENWVKMQEEKKKKAKEEFVANTKENYPNATMTESGLFYIIEEEGTGAQPQKGQNVSVHYRGTFEDGSKFDASYDRGEPITFPVGKGRVIPGWDEGLMLLKEGAKAKFIIPYWLAYGEAGRGPIPPKATLIFDVELVKVGQ